MEKNIAQLGIGYWGKNILRNLYEMGVLRTACDVSKPALEQFRAQYKDVIFTEDFDSVFSDASIKAVCIATPAATHYRIVKQALTAGKDVFVEKPLALTLREGEELVRLAEKNKRVLMVGHILHYHPAMLKLLEVIKGGTIGAIQYIYSNRLNIGKLRTEENILWSFAPHDISAILMLTGEEPKKVSAFGGDYLNKGIYDTTLTTLDFKGSVKAHIFVSWLHPYKEQKLVVVGSNGMMVFDDVSKEKLFLYPHRIEWKEGGIPVAQKAEYRTIPIEPGEPLRLELTHFVDCVKERREPRTNGREGLRVLKILEAAESSLGGGSTASGAKDDVMVHETACVDEGSRIGKGTRIWHFSHILKGSVIGKNCIIGQNVVIGPDVTIGNACKIQNNVSLYKGVTLEDEVFCGPSCVFTNVYNPRAFIERKTEFLPTLVKRGATIGANATVVCGVTIGGYALIGAGAVIKKDVPDHAVMAGVPAKQKGWACKCGTPLGAARGKKTLLSCKYCGSRYSLKRSKLSVIEEKI